MELSLQSRQIVSPWHELHAAVRLLALDGVPARERLRRAVDGHIFRILPPSTIGRQLPREMTARLIMLHRNLRRYGPYLESIDKMPEREVRDSIDEIIGIFSMVAESGRM